MMVHKKRALLAFFYIFYVFIQFRCFIFVMILTRLSFYYYFKPITKLSLFVVLHLFVRAPPLPKTFSILLLNWTQWQILKKYAQLHGVEVIFIILVVGEKRRI